MKNHSIWWTIDRTRFHDPLWITIALSVGGSAGGVTYQDNAQSRSSRHPLNDVYSSRLRASQ